MSIESVRPSNHVILCCPLLFCLQSFPASGFFPMGWLCIWWPKYWRFSFSNSPSIEYSRLISFRIDWFVAVVQSFSHVSLWPHGRQHSRFSCPWLYSGVCSSSYPLSRWCNPTISCSVVLFSPCLQSFPASESFPESTLHTWWPKYWSFSFSTSPSNEYAGLISFSIDWFDLLSVQGTLKSFFRATVWKHQFSSAQPSL